MDTYDSKYLEYCNALQIHNDLLTRLVSVSDDILRDQLTDEYLQCADRLHNLEAEYKSMEPEYLQQATDTWLDELSAFYSKQFINTTLQDALKMQGLDLLQHTTRLKMRSITSLEQKRELCHLLKCLNANIKIIDYQGHQMQYIGTPDPLIVYTIRCRGFAGVSESNDIIVPANHTSD